MLTQGPTPDSKRELNITSFLTLPHPLQCLIFAKDIIITVFLLQVMGGWEGWGGVHGCSGLGGGIGRRGSYFVCFCAAVNCSFMAGT